MPSQQLQSPLLKQHSVDIDNYIRDKQKHKYNTHKVRLGKDVVKKDCFSSSHNRAKRKDKKKIRYQ
jgi:hypothetical protein